MYGIQIEAMTTEPEAKVKILEVIRVTEKDIRTT